MDELKAFGVATHFSLFSAIEINNKEIPMGIDVLLLLQQKSHWKGQRRMNSMEPSYRRLDVFFPIISFFPFFYSFAAIAVSN